MLEKGRVVGAGGQEDDARIVAAEGAYFAQRSGEAQAVIFYRAEADAR